MWLRKWGRDSVAAGQKPLTRDDVERLVKVNGGTAQALNLSWRNLINVDLEETILRGVDLQGANLYTAKLRGATLTGAKLEGANLEGALLQDAYLTLVKLQGACLWSANLSGAFLWEADLQGADLRGSNLQGADLRNANLKDVNLALVKISSDTNLEGVKWDPDYVSIVEREGYYEEAVALYRRLKRWYQEAGMLTTAGEFHYREREATRKAEWHRLGSEFKEFVLSLKTAWRKLRSKEGVAG